MFAGPRARGHVDTQDSGHQIKYVLSSYLEKYTFTTIWKSKLELRLLKSPRVLECTMGSVKVLSYLKILLPKELLEKTK